MTSMTFAASLANPPSQEGALVAGVDTQPGLLHV